jgi:hypothetical protein
VEEMREAGQFAREQGYGLWSGCITDGEGDTNELSPNQGVEEGLEREPDPVETAPEPPPEQVVISDRRLHPAVTTRSRLWRRGLWGLHRFPARPTSFRRRLRWRRLRGLTRVQNCVPSVLRDCRLRRVESRPALGTQPLSASDNSTSSPLPTVTSGNSRGGSERISTE